MKRLPVLLAFAVAVAGFALTPCHAQESASHDNSVINVVAEDYALEAPEEIPSGWTTIEYTNEGEEPHLLFVARLPDGKTFDDYAGEVVPSFNEAWYALRDGEIDQEEFAERLGADLPDWYWSVGFLGGAGIIEPGQSTEVTLNLEPGTYALECYVKTEDGEFHSMEGMLRGLTVTDTPSGAAPPEADIEVTLSNFDMAIDGDLTPGAHTVAVHFEEQPEEGFGHNVHVVQLEPDTEVDEVIRWINFMEPDGLMQPTPGTFAGGMHILPEGATGYFKIDLEPGRYLFLSEYTSHEGVWQEVTVEP